MEKEAHFQILGSAGSIANVDILDQKITGVPKKEVRTVSFIPAFPGNPYLEKGVAWHWEHACYGSGSFRIEKDNGTAVIVSPIFFADKNVFKSHFLGLEHWNIEFWYYEEGKPPKKVKEILSGSSIHQLGKTDYLEIVASGTDFKTVKNRIDWKV